MNSAKRGGGWPRKFDVLAAMGAGAISLCFASAHAQNQPPESATIDSVYQGSNRSSDSPFGALIRLRYGAGWVRVEAYELVDGTGEVLRDLVQDDGKQSVGFDMTRRAGWKRTSSLNTGVDGIGLEAFCAPTAWYRLIEHAKELGESPRPGASAGESVWETGGVGVIVDDATSRISSAGWWDASGLPKRVFVYDDWGGIDGLVLPRLIRVQEPNRSRPSPGCMNARTGSRKPPPSRIQERPRRSHSRRPCWSRTRIPASYRIARANPSGR